MLRIYHRESATLTAFCAGINPLFHEGDVKKPRSHSHYHLALLFLPTLCALSHVRGFQVYKAGLWRVFRVIACLM
ncbi:hypothetical protein FY046_15445 [Erwinia sp. 1181_3]|nr:hypothetical protein [Erwinia rhapontici]